jgi:hypothetical protein
LPITRALSSISSSILETQSTYLFSYRYQGLSDTLQYRGHHKTYTITQAVDPDAELVISAKYECVHDGISRTPSIDVIGPGFRIPLRNMWWPKLLLGKGKIFGEERWLIGESCSKDELVILHFDTPKRKLGLLGQLSRSSEPLSAKTFYYVPTDFLDWKEFAMAWYL